MPSTRLTSKPYDCVIHAVSDTQTQPDGVERNRRFRFEEMGFASYVAAYLASSRIDVWQMQQLLDSGCPHQFATQILMGSMWSGDDPLVHWSDDPVEWEAVEVEDDPAA